MAAAMTYDSLVTDVISYAERTDTEFTSRVPRLIMLAENRIAANVRGLGLLQIVTGALTAQNPALAKPTRWRETASFSLIVGTDRVYLSPRTYEFCRDFSPVATEYGVPRYYSDYGYEHFLVAKAPDLAYNFELSYFERPEPLDETNQVSWTTQYAPQLILYATLMEAQPWLQRPEQFATFKGLYEEAAGLVSAESTRRQVDHTIIRSPE